MKGKTVVITGASGGIGSATARAFARRGAKLVLSARNVEPLNNLAEKVKAVGGEAFVVPADVTKAEDMNELAEKAIALSGGLEVMMLNAGMGILGEVHHINLAQWRHQMEVNFWGVLHGFYAALPHFLKQGHGQFIIVSSLAGKIAMPLNATYCASKFALTGFADSVRSELKKKNIGMIAVYPGFVATPFHSRIVSPDYDVPPKLGHFMADTPEKVGEAIARASEKRKGEIVFTLSGKFGSRFLPLSYTIAELFRKGMLNTTKRMIKRKPKN